ncbi:MAG: transporter substrate-binding domain-containing protein [Comamonas sp.]
MSPHLTLSPLSLAIRTTLGALALAALSAAHADATLDKIKSRKEVVIGVLINGGPTGSIDPATQRFIGWNPELARQLGRELGVDATLVQVQPSNRVQFLQAGKVDLLVASMEWTPERGEILGFAPTPFYKVGGAAIALKSSGIKRWEDLRGKPVCLSQGSNYAKTLAAEYGVQVKGFKGSAESLLALRGNNCVAAVHDSTLIYPLLKNNTDWQNYAAPIADTLTPSPSVVWTRKGETDTIAAVDRIVQGWHRSGWLIETEKRLGITPPLQALVELHDKARQASR